MLVPTVLVSDDVSHSTKRTSGGEIGVLAPFSSCLVDKPAPGRAPRDGERNGEREGERDGACIGARDVGEVDGTGG